MGKLVLLRHGQSQWNLENKFTGWVDVDLSEKGVEEAKAAGEALKGLTFDLAFTSVLIRAIRTLDLALEVMGQTGLPIVKDKAINERHYGDLQGLNKADTAKKFAEPVLDAWGLPYVLINGPDDLPRLTTHFRACQSAGKPGVCLVAEGRM